MGLEPAVRYERSRPGELVHVDVKKLGRIERGAGKRWRDGLRQHYTGRRTDAAGRIRGTAGWEYVHIAVDYSRLAYAEVLPDEKAATAAGFLRRAVAFYRRYGIHVQSVLSDNGPAYISTKLALACRRLRLKHLRTRPYRPQTNGARSRSARPPDASKPSPPRRANSPARSPSSSTRSRRSSSQSPESARSAQLAS